MAEHNPNPTTPARERGRGPGARESSRQAPRRELPPLPARTDDNYITFEIKVPQWIFCSGVVLSAVVGILVAGAAVLWSVASPPRPNPQDWFMEVEERSGKEGVAIFKAFDKSRDGLLSIIEFEPLLKHLKNITGLTISPPGEEFLEHKFIEGEEVFTVNAHFEPLLLETMTKEDILNLNLQFGPHAALSGLKNWQMPYRNESIFGIEEMKAFLPADKNIVLGVPYNIVEDKPVGIFDESRLHSNSRFYPHAPKGNEQVLYRLLGMMHPRPFVHMRFPPRGTFACVRAFNSDYLHIIFRMHAEFQLNEPPTDPFWFTPAQFVGELVITKNGSHVEYFHMHVPATKRLNVDMEWIVGGFENSNMEVDIGFMPRMEWTVSTPSSKPRLKSAKDKWDAMLVRPVTQPEDILWSSSISRDDAFTFLERAFYPFKQVTYHNLTTAYQLSKEQNKPMHAIFLWGALDDQSC